MLEIHVQHSTRNPEAYEILLPSVVLIKLEQAKSDKITPQTLMYAQGETMDYMINYWFILISSCERNIISRIIFRNHKNRNYNLRCRLKCFSHSF